MAEASTNNNSTIVVVRSLDDFPDDILLNILSFFPASRRAARTSFLSRRWRNLWLSTPSLNFSSRDFTGSACPDLETLQRFANLIDRTLSLRHPDSRLFTFCIEFTFNNGQFTSQVNSWIRYAILHNVQNLDVNLFDFQSAIMRTEDKIRFEFHLSLLEDSQVKVLKLSYCNLSVALTNDSMSDNMSFFSLQSISLSEVLLSDQMMVDLMVVCVNLETLVLSDVLGCKDIKLCSSTLRKLTLECFECDEGLLEIVAPNLHSLRIRRFLVGNYAVRDATSLVEAHVDLRYYHYWIKLVRLLGHVKHLYTDTFWFELPYLKDFYSDRFILPKLKYVELLTSYTKVNVIGIALLLDISPNLQTMVLNNLAGTFGETSEAEENMSEDFINQLNFNMPRLRHVKIKPFMREEFEKILLYGLLKVAVVLERIELIPPNLGKTPRPPIVLDV